MAIKFGKDSSIYPLSFSKSTTLNHKIDNAVTDVTTLDCTGGMMLDLQQSSFFVDVMISFHLIFSLKTALHSAATCQQFDKSFFEEGDFEVKM